MYGLDINFLKDRPGYLDTPASKTKDAGGGGGSASPQSFIPIVAGVVVAALAIGGALGTKFLYFDRENAQLQAQVDGVNADIEQQAAQTAEIDGIKAQTEAIRTQTLALATVFNQIKPWSALLQEIKDRTPTGVQMNSIQQVEVELPPDPNAAADAPPPGPVPGIEIRGLANTYDDVNDFVLLLQNSDFLGGENTQLASARITNSPVQVEVPEGSDIQVTLPDVVSFEISTPLSDKGATELMTQLESKGAIGLTSRIETLRQKGILE
ncbi:PilN domain-containing protein [Roseofilum casamattae]|uniref:PilN domain-containing protein n=1 Tax=Roseofilum casamattae BLCC-M143 TaxID=3022442 RepID=A0ABT7BVG9_9CYAN|nr:PilN domain-containing protein [Roseofilum casamattae]MDJ1183189.1 PilN domain-containing protein [Roseofilum casamattae BLCC-M143]